jgi:hypothetical protein
MSIEERGFRSMDVPVTVPYRMEIWRTIRRPVIPLLWQCHWVYQWTSGTAKIVRFSRSCQKSILPVIALTRCTYESLLSLLRMATFSTGQMYVYTQIRALLHMRDISALPQQPSVSPNMSLLQQICLDSTPTPRIKLCGRILKLCLLLTNIFNSD